MRQRAPTMFLSASLAVMLSACSITVPGQPLPGTPDSAAPHSDGAAAPSADDPSQPDSVPFGAGDRPDDDARLERILIDATQLMAPAESTVHSAPEIRAKAKELEELLPSLQAGVEEFASAVESIMPSHEPNDEPNMFNVQVSSSRPECGPTNNTPMNGVSYYLNAPLPAPGASLTTAETPYGDILAWIDSEPESAFSRVPADWSLNIRDFLELCGGSMLTVLGAYGGTDQVTLELTDVTHVATTPYRSATEVFAEGADDYFQYIQNQKIETVDPDTGELQSTVYWREAAAVARVGNMVFIMKGVDSMYGGPELATWMREVISSAKAHG